MKHKSILIITTLSVLAVLVGLWQTSAALAEGPRPERLAEIPAGAHCEKDWVAPIKIKPQMTQISAIK